MVTQTLQIDTSEITFNVEVYKRTVYLFMFEAYIDQFIFAFTFLHSETMLSRTCGLHYPYLKSIDMILDSHYRQFCIRTSNHDFNRCF